MKQRLVAAVHNDYRLISCLKIKMFKIL